MFALPAFGVSLIKSDATCMTGLRRKFRPWRPVLRCNPQARHSVPVTRLGAKTFPSVKRNAGYPIHNAKRAAIRPPVGHIVAIEVRIASGRLLLAGSADARRAEFAALLAMQLLLVGL